MRRGDMTEERRLRHRASVMRHYYANREDKIAKAAVYKESYKQRNRRFLYDYMVDKSCADCGESDMVVLEFDHVRGEKAGNISRAVAEVWSIERIEVEIAKCEVVCCNCHRRRTGSRAGWYKHVEGGY